MYTLFTDTDCDITTEIAERYGYKLISMPYTIEGEQVFPYVSFKEFNYKLKLKITARKRQFFCALFCFTLDIKCNNTHPNLLD